MYGGERMHDVGKLRGARAWWREWHRHSLRGWNGDSWNNDGSAYCRIPRVGSHPSWQASPRFVVNIARFLRARARMSRSVYPLLFSWLDAFVVQRRSSRYLGQLSEHRRDADVANFADRVCCRVRGQPAKRRVHEEPVRVFFDAFIKSCRRDRYARWGRSLVVHSWRHSVCVSMYIEIVPCCIIDDDNRPIARWFLR